MLRKDTKIEPDKSTMRFRTRRHPTIRHRERLGLFLAKLEGETVDLELYATVHELLAARRQVA